MTANPRYQGLPTYREMHADHEASRAG
jgi:hypothetical protein